MLVEEKPFTILTLILVSIGTGCCYDGDGFIRVGHSTALASAGRPLFVSPRPLNLTELCDASLANPTLLRLQRPRHCTSQPMLSRDINLYEVTGHEPLRA